LRVTKILAMRLLLLFSLTCLLLWATQLNAHGGVAFEEDACVISIGFLKAHFTGYQPQSGGNKEFCEDIPEVTESVFVIDYLHDFLKQIPVDFRIIKDVNNFGVFANWKDIESIENIDRDTVFYQPPARRPGGVLTVEYDFQQAGSYIGIVTAQHPTQDKIYRAVFQFQVGGRKYGYLPFFIALIVLAQFLYWINSGGLARFRRARAV
jgi:hypothetical protein